MWGVYVRARAAPPVHHRSPAFLAPSIRPLPRGMPNWATWGRVSESWREKGKVGPPHLSRPQAAPQSWCGRCSAPLCLLPPSVPGLLPLKRLSSCARDFPQFQLRTCRLHRSHLAWGWGGGVACLAVQPCRCGSLASWRAGCGTKPSRGAHVTAVCLGGGSYRGQCKGGTSERAGARRESQVSAGGSLGVAKPSVAFGLQGTVQSHSVTVTFT